MPDISNRGISLRTDKVFLEQVSIAAKAAPDSVFYIKENGTIGKKDFFSRIKDISTNKKTMQGQEQDLVSRMKTLFFNKGLTLEAINPFFGDTKRLCGRDITRLIHELAILTTTDSQDTEDGFIEITQNLDTQRIADFNERAEIARCIERSEALYNKLFPANSGLRPLSTSVEERKQVYEKLTADHPANQVTKDAYLQALNENKKLIDKTPQRPLHD